MFGFNKNVFGVAISFFNGITLSVTPLKCVSMNNQECKVRSEIINIISKEPVFFTLVLKQVNGVVVVTISMIHMQKCVFLMLLKT